MAGTNANAVSRSGTWFYYYFFGLHHIYLGNVVKGVLYCAFLDPWPCFFWFVSGVYVNRTYYKNLVRLANDDPTYDDEIKERIKAKKSPRWDIFDHFYAAYMSQNVIHFIVFAAKFHLFPEWSDSVATVMYLTAGLVSGYAVWACTASKWAAGSLPAVMGASIVTTFALIFLDKGAPPEYVDALYYVKSYLTAAVCFLTRSYKKTPSRHAMDGLENRRKGAYAFLFLFGLHWLTVNTQARNITYNIVTTGRPGTKIPTDALFPVVKKFANGKFSTALQMFVFDVHDDDKWKRQKAEKMIATGYAEFLVPWEEEEMTPMRARELLGVDTEADKKRIHKAYRDASRKYVPLFTQHTHTHTLSLPFALSLSLIFGE